MAVEIKIIGTEIISGIGSKEYNGAVQLKEMFIN
jgi:hypothetical protein